MDIADIPRSRHALGGIKFAGDMLPRVTLVEKRPHCFLPGTARRIFHPQRENVTDDVLAATDRMWIGGVSEAAGPALEGALEGR